MRLYRFYIENANFETLAIGDEFLCTEPGVTKQITLVLRAKIGESVIFFNKTGEYECKITGITSKIITTEAIKKVDQLVQRKQVILVQSLIKKDKFEWVAQKATELGVTDIFPVLTERSQKKELDENRLLKIIVEATEQSGWGRVPILHPISSLDQVLKTLKNNNVSIHALQMNGGTKQETGTSVALCVGPEGGWSQEELCLFSEKGVYTLSLGESVLRSETASIVGTYLMTL